jgi:hypothetical protein
MEEDRATLLRRRIDLYRETLRAGVTGKVAIGYLRQIDSDEAELVQIRHSRETGMNARGLSADARPVRPLRKFLAELIDQFDALPVTDSRRASVAARIRRVEAEIARRRQHQHTHYHHTPVRGPSAHPNHDRSVPVHAQATADTERKKPS